MSRAIIYVRVSTNVQEDNYSFSTQLAACHTYAAQQGMTVIAEFQEVESGGTLNRPELDKARDLIRTGLADALIVYSMDRLSRRLADMLLLREELRQHNAELHFSTRGASNMTAEGDLFDNIEGAFAQYERIRIKERLWRGREGKIKGTASKPAQIYGNGNCPYGYTYIGRKKDRQIIVNEVEAIVVGQMYSWCLSGLSVKAIAHLLNGKGAPTPAQAGRAAGNIKREQLKWTGAMVWRILKSEVYAGIMYFNKTHRIGTRDIQVPRDQWLPVPVPAIIDQEAFLAVQERLSSARKGSKRNAKHFYLLGRGKMKCQCGYTMSGSSHPSCHGKYSHRYYRCHHHTGETIWPCTLGEINAPNVEQIVWDWLYSILTPGAIQQGIEAHQQSSASERAQIDVRSAALSKRRDELEREADKMILAYKAGAISLDELKQDKTTIDAERKLIDHEYARLEELRRDATWYDAEALRAEAAELREYMPLMNNYEKATLLDRVFLSVVRELNDHGEKVVRVECRLGAATLPLKAPAKSQTSDGESTPASAESIDSLSYSSR